MSRLPSIHPGEVLVEEFLRPAGLSVAELAERVGVPVDELAAVVEGRGRITPVVATALGEYLQTGADFWTNLQLDFEGRRRPLTGAQERFARFGPDFMADGRGDQEQDER